MYVDAMFGGFAAAVFAAFLLAFLVIYAFAKKSEMASVAVNAMTVNAITAVAYIALGLGVGTTVSPNEYILWIANVFSFYLMARIFATHVDVKDPNAVDHLAFTAAVMALGPVMGLHFDLNVASVWWQIYLASIWAVVMMYWILRLSASGDNADAKWSTAVGIVLMILYIALYFFDLTMNPDTWMTAGVWIMFALDVLFKGCLPILFIIRGNGSLETADLTPLLSSTHVSNAHFE